MKWMRFRAGDFAPEAEYELRALRPGELCARIGTRSLRGFIAVSEMSVIQGDAFGQKQSKPAAPWKCLATTKVLHANRDPSTPQTDRFRESVCSAQDDKPEWRSGCLDAGGAG